MSRFETLCIMGVYAIASILALSVIVYMIVQSVSGHAIKTMGEMDRLHREYMTRQEQRK
jgi:hypothetical protein